MFQSFKYLTWSYTRIPVLKSVKSIIYNSHDKRASEIFTLPPSVTLPCLSRTQYTCCVWNCKNYQAKYIIRCYAQAKTQSKVKQRLQFFRVYLPNTGKEKCIPRQLLWECLPSIWSLELLLLTHAKSAWKHTQIFVRITNFFSLFLSDNSIHSLYTIYQTQHSYGWLINNYPVIRCYSCTKHSRVCQLARHQGILLFLFLIPNGGTNGGAMVMISSFTNLEQSNTPKCK